MRNRFVASFNLFVLFMIISSSLLAAFDFDQSVPARPAALVFFNPAGLALVHQEQVGFSAHRVSGRNYRSLQIITDYMDLTTGFGYLGSELFSSYYLSSAVRLNTKSALGASLKFVDENSHSLGLDLGAVYKLNRDIRLNLSAQNLFVLTWLGQNQQPSTYKVGVRLKKGSFIIISDLDYYNYSIFKYHLGLEYRQSPALILRIGTDNGPLSAGFGLKHKSLALDFSWYKNLGEDVYRVALTSTLGKKL
jgi:hypothetical protein